ncbi:hypothetical protein VDIAB_110675 [Vibrio diabolicus]|nr:hypothetical protein VDIAB_110675 [Vibrio diabolicus]
MNAISAFRGYNGKELCLIVIDTFCLSKGAQRGSESVTQNLLTTLYPKQSRTGIARGHLKELYRLLSHLRAC